MNLYAISSPQSHLSKASSMNPVNTQGNGRDKPPPSHRLTITFISCSAADSSPLPTHFFSMCGLGVEVLPSCGSAVPILWVLSVPTTLCAGQPTKRGTIRNRFRCGASCMTLLTPVRQKNSLAAQVEEITQLQAREHCLA